MNRQDELKKHCALAAVKQIASGMIVGLGTGSTANYMIDELGKKCRDKSFQIKGIPTSERTAQRAQTAGIELTSLETHSDIDVTIDGYMCWNCQAIECDHCGKLALDYEILDNAFGTTLCTDCIEIV